MKENKRILWFSIYITIIAIGVSWITFNFEIGILKWINSFSQSILAGSVVLIGTSAIGYMRQRKLVLEGFLKELGKLEIMFDELKYFNKKELMNFEKYDELMKESNEAYMLYSETEKRDTYKKYILENDALYKNELIKMMQEYIKLDEYSLEFLNDLYGELEFFMDVNKKERDYVYNEVYSYIHEIFIKIRKATIHFKKYLESEDGNIFVNWNILIDLQNEFFKQVSNTEIKNYSNAPYMSYFDSDLNKYITYVNYIAYQLNKKYKEVWKKTYNKKDI